jgi:hypothetical protein
MAAAGLRGMLTAATPLATTTAARTMVAAIHVYFAGTIERTASKMGIRSSSRFGMQQIAADIVGANAMLTPTMLRL